MKRYLFLILLVISDLSVFAQENVTLFFLNDGSFKGFYDEEIDSITYSHLDIDSIWHSDAVVQEIWITDSVIRIPIESIDSICHKVPEPEYKQEVIRLDERYLPYIQSVNGNTISFSSALPAELRPQKGNVLLYENSSELFPEGFAGKVISEGDMVTCEDADFQDIYNRFVFFGKYAVVNKRDIEHPSYALKRIKMSKIEGNNTEDFGIDNWRMGDGTIPDITLGTIKHGWKLSFKKFGISFSVDASITPVVSIEYAYDGYWLNPLLFYKCTTTNSYSLKFKADYSHDFLDPKKNDKFWGEDQPDWIEIFQEADMADENDGDTIQTIYVVDEAVPVPEFPLLKVGFKVGFFCEPRITGELSVGGTVKGTFQRTFIYNLDKNHWLSLSDDWKDYLLPWRASTMKYLEVGEKSTFKGPTTCETDFFVEGSAKASLWTGLIGAVNVSLGISKNAELKEEAKVRVGPYIEGEIKANFKDAVADQSMYSLLQDTKIKNGVKLGVDLKFSAKLKSKLTGKDWCGIDWTQLSWGPKDLLWERNLYLLPQFSAPKYSTRGNSLTCTTEVSRQTFPNTIGFTLVDETGKELQRFWGTPFKYYQADNPHLLTLTFDHLDFAHHRYTIIPTTRVFDLDLLEMKMPSQYQTTVLCPDSRHPHLIDLGLPSGTKWLCSNVYANAPEEAGGYYQWGKNAMVHNYSSTTYKAPYVKTIDFQNTEFDAATGNLGDAYATPTKAQFDELLSRCSATPKTSTWGYATEGIYLKGKNGNNLYLPFAGYKEGTSVQNDPKDTGFFLLSDARDDDGVQIHNALMVKSDNTTITDAKEYGYSVRPVSADKAEVSFEPQRIDFEEVLIVGMSLGTVSRSVVVSNNGGTDAVISVSQTQAPFKVDEASPSTFTLKPKEIKVIYISFEPTEIGDYSTNLNIQYETNNACTVCKIPLLGQGVEKLSPKKAIQVEPLNIDFGTSPKGKSREEYFTVTNTGEDVLIFTIGNPGENFTISEAGVEQMLPVGESKQFTVTYLGNLETGDEVRKHINIESNATNVDTEFGLDLHVVGVPGPEEFIYTKGIGSDLSPEDGLQLASRNVWFGYTVKAPHNGVMIVEIMLYTYSDINGLSKGERLTNVSFMMTYGSTRSYCCGDLDGYELQPNTTYYWNLRYFDPEADSFVNCSPLMSFTTGD